MIDILLLFATWACGALGFALLAFSQLPHWRLLPQPRADQPPGWLRPLGWGLLGAAILPAIARDGIAFGLLLWIGVLTLSACAIVWLLMRLTHRP
ncbi:DUF3325 family protein [Altererythrobacter xixiisoli]|uniref:DUF3325 family protein n=1 Tax=Croceibacterium xixiisoli TaxID=1476466 RepID=A0A6I4TXS6_9SPHN|nr:DUF3325 family protein [Croceibacterium xixiisoli]MXP00743.1 DUF3325 family protein [Croceibacterium xixiisoli]